MFDIYYEAFVDLIFFICICFDKMSDLTLSQTNVSICALKLILIPTTDTWIY